MIEKLRFNETLKLVLNRLVDDLIQNTRQNLKRTGIGTVQDVRTFPERLVRFSDEVESERRETKSFLYASLYFSSALESDKEDAERVIGELFDHWMKQPSSLPTSYQEKARQEALPRIVCDYIAGMTDNFIYEQHEKYIRGHNT